jgi:hypothetical protein
LNLDVAETSEAIKVPLNRNKEPVDNLKGDTRYKEVLSLNQVLHPPNKVWLYPIKEGQDLIKRMKGFNERLRDYILFLQEHSQVTLEPLQQVPVQDILLEIFQQDHPPVTSQVVPGFINIKVRILLIETI